MCKWLTHSYGIIFCKFSKAMQLCHITNYYPAGKSVWVSKFSMTSDFIEKYCEKLYTDISFLEEYLSHSINFTILNLAQFFRKKRSHAKTLLVALFFHGEYAVYVFMYICKNNVI